MINLVCSGIKGMKNVINYSDNYSYETGNLIGYKVSSESYSSSSSTSLKHLNLSIKAHNNAGMYGEVFESYGVYNNDELMYTDDLLFDNKVRSISTGASSSTAGMAWDLYDTALDLIQEKSMSSRPSSQAASVRAYIENAVGRDVSDTLSTILEDIPDSTSDNLTRYILTENNDQTATDTRAAIESFTSTNYQLATGVGETRSGRSYYCDEITTLEFDEAKDRVDSLVSKLSSLGDKMVSLSNMIVGWSDDSALQDIVQLGYVDDGYDSKPVLPSTFFSLYTKATVRIILIDH